MKKNRSPQAMIWTKRILLPTFRSTQFHPLFGRSTRRRPGKEDVDPAMVLPHVSPRCHLIRLGQDLMPRTTMICMRLSPLNIANLALPHPLTKSVICKAATSEAATTPESTLVKVIPIPTTTLFEGILRMKWTPLCHVWIKMRKEGEDVSVVVLVAILPGTISACLYEKKIGTHHPRGLRKALAMLKLRQMTPWG